MSTPQKQNEQTNKRLLREQQRGVDLRPLPPADSSAMQPMTETEPLIAPDGGEPVNYLSPGLPDQSIADQGFTPEAERLLRQKAEAEEIAAALEEEADMPDEDEDFEEEPLVEEPTSGAQEQPGWQEPEPAADYTQPEQYEQFPGAAPDVSKEPAAETQEAREQAAQATEQQAREQAAAEAAAAEQEQRRQLEAERREAAQEKSQGPMGAVAGLLGGEKKDDEEENLIKKAKKIRMYASIGCALFSLLMGLITIMGGASLLEGLM